jgi:DDE_Tnp_1-associated
MLINALKEIEDPRSYHGKEYQLWQILLVSILSILSNGKTYTDIRIFLDVHYGKLNAIFKFKWRQLPDESAIRKIIVRVDPAHIEEVFRRYALKNKVEGRRHICFDGKALNGSFSHTRDKRAFHVFSAFCANSQIVLAHIPLAEDKDHEIQAFQEFIMSLDLKGVVITADAIHCQKKHLSVPNLQGLS